MNTQKQLDTIECLKSSEYSVTDSEVISTRTKEPLVGSQVRLFNGKRGMSGKNVLVYLHIAIYLYHYGTYPEDAKIEYIDGDKENTHYTNLRLKLQQPTRPKKTTGIRADDIYAIRCYMIQGKTQTWISRELGLNRCSVRYTMNHIEAGIPLKFEQQRGIVPPEDRSWQESMKK